MANVNCPLCKGAVWIPAEKAETISPEELAKVIDDQLPIFDCPATAQRIAAAILEKFTVGRR